MHDPSTVIQADGKFYVYGTGNGLPAFVSDDGWTWRRAGQVMQAVPGGRPGPEVLAKGGNNTWAPDIIRSGDRYFLYYSAPGTQPKSAIGLLVGKTLDPASPDYKWEDAGPVVWSDGVEDCNAIDPGVFRDPTNGTLWLTYGSYFGYIRLVAARSEDRQAAPSSERKPVNVAINSEASIMIFRDGWYYLLVTHGSCCAGANSSYNIRMGRARKVTGPFLDNMGIDMLQGGGKLFAGSTRPPHRSGTFRPARSRRRRREVLAALRSRSRSRRHQRAGHPAAALARRLARGRRQLHRRHLPDRIGAHRDRPGDGGAGRAGRRPAAARARAAPAPAARHRRRRRSRRRIPRRSAATGPPVPVGVRMGPHMVQAQQKWSIEPAPNAGGYPGAPYFKIAIAGTDRVLAATADAELTVLPAFTGAPEQLWRLDQLGDGTYRLMPKAVPGTAEALALSAIGSSTPTLARFRPDSDRQRWLIKAP